MRDTTRPSVTRRCLPRPCGLGHGSDLGGEQQQVEPGQPATIRFLAVAQVNPVRAGKG